jgi:hypothetical protein
MWSWTDVALVLVAYALLAALLGWYSVTQIRRAFRPLHAALDRIDHTLERIGRGLSPGDGPTQRQ